MTVPIKPAFDSRALGKNVAPTTATEPRVIKSLNRSATNWLRENDPNAETERLKQQRADRKAKHQARTNRRLVNVYRKAISPKPIRLS